MAYFAVLMKANPGGSPGRRIQATRWQQVGDVIEFRKGKRLVDRVEANRVLEVEKYEHSVDADDALARHRDRKAGAATRGIVERAVARPTGRRGPGRSAQSTAAGSPPAEAISVRVTEAGVAGKKA